MLKYLTKEEKEALFQEIYKDDSIHRKRNIAIFEVALYCGLRVSEITQMQLDDYDRSSHNIHCRRLKNSNSNTLQIVDKHVIKALDDYLAEREQISATCSTSTLFLSQKKTPISRQRLDTLMKQYCSNANIPPSKWHMHVLRHTRAIDLAELQLDIDDIKYWLGHKNIKNTFIYLEYTIGLKKYLFKNLSIQEGGAYEDRY